MFPPPRPRQRLLALALGLALGAVIFVARWQPEVRPEAIRDGDPASRVGSAEGAAAKSAPVARPVPVFARDALFAFDQPANASALDAALPAPAREISYVRLNATLIANPKTSPFWKQPGVGRIDLPLPGGGSLRVVIDDTESLGVDRFTSTGHVEGQPDSRAVFAWNAGYLHASVDAADLGSFALRAATEEFSQFYRVDPALVGACGGARTPVVDAAALSVAAARQARAAELGASSATAPAAAAAADNPQRAEIHVLMAYTQSVLATLAGAARTAALQSAFDAAIAKVNSDFAASAISARVKLVRLVETQYDENASPSGAVQDQALTALYRVDDGKMDELHRLRDQSGADLVCVALNRADFASTGLAFVLNKPGDNTNSLFAFSVVQYGVIAGTNLVSHELGHNFGCSHDREHTTSGGAYPYSYGYRFTASNGRQYHDIMSYDPGTGLSYFSNPNLFAPAPAPANSPGGIAPGSPGESATAFTIEQDAFEVATFRLQTPAAATASTLLNVATRAYVGTGEQVLIAGFVVTGTTPKKMLLRAVGPALGAFGPSAGLLADPALELYTGPTRIFANDNWSAQANGATAAEIAAAAAQAGAFALPNNSADAALLVTLAPGVYTSIVRGAGGATGTALVEAYEVGAGATNRLINLSSRAFADNTGRPLVGGFVVAAAAGTTKRVLIRVLGPSLAKFKIADAMDDPFMELRNAAGDLLIKNDDWSTGTVAGTANAVNDFSPSVRFYNEQQISATGYAPGNRREPCVLVELPAGNYTIVATPFELRDSDPAIDQPAKPGVALVEVYEIGP